MQEQNNIDVLTGFFHVARNDVRITSTHISLYFALFRYYVKNRMQNPFHITRKAVMAYAKVSIATYHKCIVELHKFGYISYFPSYHPAIGSTIILHTLNG